MMTDIYNAPADEADKQQPQGQPPADALQIPDEVLEFVGPGKKYATLADALKSVPNAQKHIQTLEDEMKQLRADKGSALSQEEVYAAVQDYLKQNGGQAGSGLDATAVDSLLDRKLKEREAQQTAAQNVATFKSAMGQKFGDEAKQVEVFKAKAAELGLPVETLGQIVRTSPKAALAYFGIEPGKTVTGSAPPSGVNTSTFSEQSSQQGLKTYRGASTSDLVAEFKRLRAEVEKRHK